MRLTASSASSLIQGLPDELLAEIFIRYCHGLNVIKVLSSGPPSVRLVGLELASVCMRWRAVYYSLPSLQSGVYVDCNKATRILSEAEIATVARVLDLSHPLESVELILNSQATQTADYIGALSNQLSKHLQPSLHRVRHLTLHFAFPFLIQPPGTFSSLHSLVLVSVSAIGFVMTAVRPPIDLTLSAPNLQSLQVGDHFSSVRVNWKNIRHLSLIECNSEYILTTIAECSQLDSLKLDGCYSDNTLPATTRDILNISTLRHLEVKRAYSTPHYNFLACINRCVTMPSLTHCQFHYRNPLHHPPGAYSMSQFMRHAQGSIKHVTLGCRIQLPADEVKAVFSTCLQVETVTLGAVMPVDNSKALGLLHWPALPLLKTLHLAISLTDTNQMAVVSMMKSRWEAEEGRKLETLFMNRYTNIGKSHPIRKKEWNEDTRTALKAMQKEGLKVFITD